MLDPKILHQGIRMSFLKFVLRKIDSFHCHFTFLDQVDRVLNENRSAMSLSKMSSVWSVELSDPVTKVTHGVHFGVYRDDPVRVGRLLARPKAPCGRLTGTHSHIQSWKKGISQRDHQEQRVCL